MRILTKAWAIVFLCLFFVANGWAADLTILIHNPTEWTMIVKGIQWTKKGVDFGAVVPEEPNIIIASGESEFGRFPIPAGATDHKLDVDYATIDDTTSCVFSVYPNPETPIEFSWYVDFGIDTLHVAYDISGPGDPVFCASEPEFDSLTEQYGCTDPTPTNPVLAGSATVYEDVPSLTEWGLIILLGLLFVSGVWVILRRRKRLNVGM